MVIKRSMLDNVEDNSIRFFKDPTIEKEVDLPTMDDSALINANDFNFNGESESDALSDLSEPVSDYDEDDKSEFKENEDAGSEDSNSEDTDEQDENNESGDDAIVDQLNKSVAISYDDDSFSRDNDETPAERGRPSACVFVASLSSNLSDDILCQSVTSHFKQWGTISLVKVLRDPANRPYAFVQYKKDEDAKRAIAEGQHSLLNGRTVRCERARVNRTLYIETTNKGLCDAAIRALLEKFGEIERLVGVDENNAIVDSADGDHTYWFCKFVYRQDAISAYANLKIKPFWNVEWAQNLEDESNDTPEVTIDKYSIFVGQLDPRISREDLFERFELHGKIKEAILVNRPLNNFAFIKFETRKAAASAVERENHSMFKFKTIHVQYREMYNNYKRKYSGDNGVKLNLAPPPVSFRRRHSYSISSNRPKKSPTFNRSGFGSFSGPSTYQQPFQQIMSPPQHNQKQSFGSFRRPSLSHKKYSFGHSSPNNSSQKGFKSSFDFGYTSDKENNVEFKDFQFRRGSSSKDSNYEKMDNGLTSDDEQAANSHGNDFAPIRNTYTGYSNTTNGASKTVYSYTSVDGDEYGPPFPSKGDAPEINGSSPGPIPDAMSPAPGFYPPPQMPCYYIMPSKELGYMNGPVSNGMPDAPVMIPPGTSSGRPGGPPSHAYYYTYSPYDPNANPAMYPYYMYYNPNIPGTPTDGSPNFIPGGFDQQTFG